MLRVFRAPKLACAGAAILALSCLALCLTSCEKKSAPVQTAARRVAVFIPGVRAGNPVYDELAAGAEALASEMPGLSVKVLEAGFNQAEWEEKLTALAAEARYDFILTSNPSMPELCARVGQKFPSIRFICLDGMLDGNPSIYSALYNQTEQGYATGYLAGLVTASGMRGANKALKVGLIIGQHYPVMDRIIRPGIESGLAAAAPGAALELRVLGNWYDAARAAELAKGMIDSGVDLIVPICGGASLGVINAARAAGVYVIGFDGDDYDRAPGTVIACSRLRQKELAAVKLREALEGRLPFGKAEVFGMKEGYVEFLDASPRYAEGLPDEQRVRMGALLERLRSGELSLCPTL